MAARNRPGLSENTRQRIKTTMLVDRLQKQALSDVDFMTPIQMRAIEVLLKKTLPDLSQLQHTGKDGGDLIINLPERDARL